MVILRILIFLFLFSCLPQGAVENIAGEASCESIKTAYDLEDVDCSLYDFSTTFPSIQGDCSYLEDIFDSIPLHHINRQLQEGEFICVVERYIEVGEGRVIPL